MINDKPWTGDPEQEPTIEQALKHAALGASSRMEKRLSLSYSQALDEIDRLRGALDAK